MLLILTIHLLCWHVLSHTTESWDTHHFCIDSKFEYIASSKTVEKPSLEEFSDLSVEGSGSCCRGPAVDHIAIPINEKFLKIPLDQPSLSEEVKTRATQPWGPTLILVNPKRPAFCDFKYLYTSFVFGPLTSDFCINGNSTPWFKVQNSAMAWSLPDSCPANLALSRQRKNRISQSKIVDT